MRTPPWAFHVPAFSGALAGICRQLSPLSLASALILADAALLPIFWSLAHLFATLNEEPRKLGLASGPESSEMLGALYAIVLVQAGLIAGLVISRKRYQRVEASLRLSEERYREVVEGQKEMVCRYRADHTLTFVNEAYCRFFGKSRDELMGVNFLSLIPPDMHPLVRETTRKLLSEKKAIAIEHEVLRPDGNVGWMEWEDFPVLDDEGKIHELQGVGRDITERRHAEDARLEAERRLSQASRLALLGELAASIAHEINQPLGAILSNAEAAEMLLETESHRELRNILADIRSDDLRASEIIQHVRHLVADREAKLVSLEINAKVKTVLRLVAADAHRRGIILTSELAAELPEVIGDRVQLEQVLLNLVLNGMDAMKDTPDDLRRLVIRTCSVTDDTIEISVVDAGHGIPPERLPRIFDSFYTTKEDGMGLGLTLARSIAELHRGSITAENNPMRGATFRLRLPTGIRER